MALGQKVLLYKMTGLNCTLANVGIIFVRFLICWSDLELPGVFSQIHPLLSQPFFFPSFWLHQAACGILVSWLGIEPQAHDSKGAGPPGNSPYKVKYNF